MILLSIKIALMLTIGNIFVSAIQQTCNLTSPCPPNSTCRTQNSYCQCNPGFIGYCDIPAAPLGSSDLAATLEPQKIKYFTIDPILIKRFLEFTITICQKEIKAPLKLYTWGQSGPQVAFNIDRTLVAPSFLEFNSPCIELITQYIIFSQQPNGLDDLLVLGLQSQIATQVTLKVQQRQAFQIYVYYYIMMAVISFFSAFLLVCTIVLILKRRLNHQAYRRNALIDPNGRNNIEYFQTYMPAKKASNSLQNTPCPICLQTFQHDQDIRTTPCDHNFHLCCLDAWCAKNLSCPICRHQLTQQKMKQIPKKVTKQTNDSEYHKNWQQQIQMQSSPSKVNKDLRVAMIQ